MEEPYVTLLENGTIYNGAESRSFERQKLKYGDRVKGKENRLVKQMLDLSTVFQDAF